MPWAFVVVSGWLFPVHTRYLAVLALDRDGDLGRARHLRHQVQGRRLGAPARRTGDRIAETSITWETFWLPTAMPRDLTFVYKRELNWVPFFGWGIASAQMISIDRSKGQDAFEQVVEQGKDRLARGWWIVIFPKERARSRARAGATRPAVQGSRCAPARGRCRLPSTRASSGQRESSSRPRVPYAYRSAPRLIRAARQPTKSPRSRNVDRIGDAQTGAASLQRAICTVERQRCREGDGGGGLKRASPERASMSQQLLLAFEATPRSRSIPRKFCRRASAECWSRSKSSCIGCSACGGARSGFKSTTVG